ncbi:hypothetical protein B0H14DRAFT_3484074 [Mycena olivaceomarginata]|nr:hypothetical protein B0H14DRAFT_3484074 [Mycena olivaceomarginata]
MAVKVHFYSRPIYIGLTPSNCIPKDPAGREEFSDWVFSLNIATITEPAPTSLIPNPRNELSHRTARNTKRHTGAIQKAQQAYAAQKKIAEFRAQLAIAVAEAKLIRRGSRNAEEQDQISRYSVLLPFLSLN